jgi:hypothetical protein
VGVAVLAVTAHPLNDSVDAREGEDILNRDGVDFSIVEYWPKTSILLFDIEDRS